MERYITREANSVDIYHIAAGSTLELHYTAPLTLLGKQFMNILCCFYLHKTDMSQKPHMPKAVTFVILINSLED